MGKKRNNRHFTKEDIQMTNSCEYLPTPSVLKGDED